VADAKKIDPFDVEALEKSLNDSATRVSTIWVSFLAFALYLLVAAATVDHRHLLLAEPVKLPILNIDLPLWGFFFLAPIQLVIFHIYVLLQVLLLGRTAAAYDEALQKTGIAPEENAAMRQRLANTLFAQLFAGSPREREGWLGWVMKAMAWTTLAIAPILILLAFQFAFLAYHSHFATWMHRLLILLELGVAFLLWPLVLDARRDFNWSRIRERMKRSVGPGSLLLVLSLLTVFVSLAVASFPGELHVNLATGHSWPSVQCDRWISTPFDRLYLSSAVDIVDEKKFNDIDAGTLAGGPTYAHGRHTKTFHGRDLNCGVFRFADLRRVDFSSAKLTGADFSYAKLQGAKFVAAEMQNAGLLLANLQEATFGAAQLQGADLRLAQLPGADLQQAQLQGADLRAAVLQGAYLHDARLEGANLEAAELQGANLQYARFQGAELKDAELVGAFLIHAQMQGANLDHSNLAFALLNDANLWPARGLECQFVRTTQRNFDPTVEIPGDGDPSMRQVSATPETIGSLIERVVAGIPEPQKAQVKKRMSDGLAVDPNSDDGAAMEKKRRDCVAHSLPPATYDRGHADALRDVVCNATSYRKGILYGVIWNGLYPYSERGAFAVGIYRGLLNLDGKECPAAKELDEPTREMLRGRIARTVPSQSTKKAVPHTAPAR
jgi:uncharacterized protein YjbI with pentapeptide repeats